MMSEELLQAVRNLNEAAEENTRSIELLTKPWQQHEERICALESKSQETEGEGE